ncbi:DUF1566 domain-containing protein [bacterium]|nr:DUF1566 domain-containing protein [bacterium]
MKKICVFFAVLAALIFVVSCGGGGDNNPKTNEDGGNSETSSEDDDSYAETEPTDPKEIRVSECTKLPEHAQWNTVSEIKQSWDGRSWQPPKEGSYNETPSTSECRFKCVADYHWDGSTCIVDCDPDSLPALPECSESSGTPCEDSSTHLIWSNRKSLTHDDALSYCGGLWEEGGVCGGWRLPTISELRTLIIRCEGSMSEGSCAVKDPDCLSEEKCWSDDCYCEGTGNGFFSKLGGSGSYWSSNQCSNDPDCDSHCGRFWGVDFFNASVRCLNEYSHVNVSTGDGTDGKYDIRENTLDTRCVRIR